MQSDHQNLRVNYDTAVYTSKERLDNKNEFAYCINNNVILFNTEHGFIKNKYIASCSSDNYANCIHYWSYRDCQVKKPTMKVFFHSVCCVIDVIVLIAQI